MKKLIIALMMVLLIATPAIAGQHRVGLKTGGYLSSDSLGVPGASSTSYSSPSSDQGIPPFEGDYNFKPDVDWFSISGLVGAYAGQYSNVMGTADTWTVYVMAMPRIEMQTSLGDVFSWIPGISNEPVPPPDDVIDDMPPVLDTDRDFDPEKRVRAYAGFGLGGAWNDYKWEVSEETKLSTNEFTFVYSPSVGAAWAFNPALEMTFDYRYIRMAGGDTNNPSGHLFLVGLMYAFK